jgi:hypothetical protein
MAKSPYLTGKATSSWFSRRAGSNTGGSHPRHNNEGFLVDEFGHTVLDGANAPIELGRTTTTFPEYFEHYSEDFPNEANELDSLNGCTTEGLIFSASSNDVSINFTSDLVNPPVFTLPPLNINLGLSNKAALSCAMKWRIRDTNLNANVPDLEYPDISLVGTLTNGMQTSAASSVTVGHPTDPTRKLTTWKAAPGDPFGKLVGLSVHFGAPFINSDWLLQISYILITEGAA